MTKEEILEGIKGLTALELSELVHDLEEAFGVSAAAPVAVAAVGGAAAGGDAGAAEEKSDFDVVLESFGDNKIVVPNSKVSKFIDESYIGKEVVMGIRPENIHDEPVVLQTYANATIDVNVEVTELMGSETYLYLKTTGKDDNIIARVDPRTSSRAGSTIKIAFDVNHLHFFDKETEKTILNR